MNKKSFLKTTRHYFSGVSLITLALVCAQTNLFAPKGGGVCSSSGDSYSGRGDCYSGFGSGHCAEPCVGGYNAGDREANSHGGGNSSSGGGSGSAYDGSAAAPAISSAAAVETASRQLLDQCYVVYSNRQAMKTCSKQEVLSAVAAVAKLHGGVAAGKMTDDEVHNKIMGLINLGIPLDCAVARPAPVEQCLDLSAHETIKDILALKQDREEQKMAALEAQIECQFISGMPCAAQAHQVDVITIAQHQAQKLCTDADVVQAGKIEKTFFPGLVKQQIPLEDKNNLVDVLSTMGVYLDRDVALKAMKCIYNDAASAAQTGSAPFIFSLNEARAMVDEITQERLAGVSQTYNEVIKGTKTVAQAKQALDAAVAQGLPLAAMGDIVVVFAEKVKREIEHEVAEYKQLLLRPKRFNAAQLAAAMNCNGGMYNLPPAELADLTHQFGGERWLIRAFELTTRRCAAPQKMHLCYSYVVGGGVIAGHPGVAAFDAMTDAQVAARLHEADRQLAVARAQGL